MGAMASADVLIAPAVKFYAIDDWGWGFQSTLIGTAVLAAVTVEFLDSF